MAETPERFFRVSQTQLSVARYYGGCKFNGVHYVYDATNDTLIRDDVFKREKAEKRKTAKQTAKVKRERKVKEKPKLFE